MCLVTWPITAREAESDVASAFSRNRRSRVKGKRSKVRVKGKGQRVRVKSNMFFLFWFSNFNETKTFLVFLSKFTTERIARKQLCKADTT